MHTRTFRMRVAFLLVPALCLAACARVESPYSKIPNPPLVKAQLHTMTVLATADGLAAQLATRGYSRTSFPLSNPGALRVEAALWKVPEDVIAQGQYHIASSGPSLRLLIGLLPEEEPHVDEAVLRDFYRNVLGVEPPHWPANVPKPDNAHVLGWTLAVPSVVEAARRCREQGVPVDFNPVAITTAYLGDHKTMAIRAPDGAILELFEGAAQ